MKEKVKEKEYSLLRVILTVLVVMGHSAYFMIATKYGGVNYHLNLQSVILSFFNKITTWIYTFHMPLFICLSGAVYALSEKNNLDELASRKFKRLLIPYFLVGLLFMLPIKRLFGFYNGNYGLIVKEFLSMTSETGHLWFLPVLFWNTIIFFCLKKLTKGKSLTALLIITFIIQKYYATYIPIDFFALKQSMSYLFYFTFGYCLEIWRKKNKNFLDKKFLWLIGFGGGAFVALLNFKYNFLDAYWSFFINLVLLFALCYRLSKTKFADSKIVKTLEKYSMSIYLFHDPLQYIILFISFKYNLLVNETSIIIFILCRLVGTILVSILIAKIIEFFKNKMKEKKLFN